MVHTSNLGADHYYLSSNEQDLIGKKSREVFTIGQKSKVFVIKVDRFKRQIILNCTAQTNSRQHVIEKLRTLRVVTYLLTI